MHQLTDRLVAGIAFLPVGLDRLVHTAIPALRDRTVVPFVAFALLALAGVAFVQAGLELVTTRTVPSEVIERRVGSATMLEVTGLAFPTGLPAGTDAAGRDLQWVAMRDDLDAASVMLVRTPLTPGQLRTRFVTGRVEGDPALVAATADALAARGTPLSAGDRVLVEDPAARDPRAIDDAAQLASLPDGTAVRIELRFTARGIATCALEAPCALSELAGDRGAWLQQAVSAETSSEVLVRTAHPPSIVPLTLIGEQVRRAPSVQALKASRLGDELLGDWLQVLEAAQLDHDASLPVDRLWVALLALAGMGVLLLVARRLPYPAFRHAAPGPRVAAPASADGIASGRLGLGDGPPVDVVNVPVRLERGSEAPVLVARLSDGTVRLELAVASAAVSTVEHGRLAWLAGSRPALWIHWYRTDLRVAFTDAASRDAAAALLAPLATRPVSPPPAPPPTARPPRRVAPRPTEAEEEEPVPWRRPRPRGAR